MRSVTKRFLHSTASYRYQFKFQWVYPVRPRRKLDEGFTRWCAVPSSSPLVRPYLLFPSIPPRENRVEMALNYTDPIEFTTLPSGATCANATTVFFDGHSLYSSFPCFSPLPNSDSFHPWIERKKEILILVAEIEVFHGKLEIENGKTIFFFFFFFCNLAKSYVLLEISLDVRILFSRSN